MIYSTSSASKASSGASVSSTNTLVAEATSLLFVVAFVMAVSAFYDISTPAITYAPSIIFVTVVYAYAVAAKIFAVVVASIKWAAFAFVWRLVDIAIPIDKAVWAILRSVGLSTFSDAAAEKSAKSDDKAPKKTVTWAPTVHIKYIKSCKDMTKEEKLANGYTMDFYTKYPVELDYDDDDDYDYEPIPFDAPRKMPGPPKLVIGLRGAILFPENEEVEEEEDPANDDDSTDQEGTNFNDVSIYADSSTDAIQCEVNAVSSSNDDLGVKEEESDGNDDGVAELEVEVDADSMSFSNDDSGARGR